MNSLVRPEFPEVVGWQSGKMKTMLSADFVRRAEVLQKMKTMVQPCIFQPNKINGLGRVFVTTIFNPTPWPLAAIDAFRSGRFMRPELHAFWERSARRANSSRLPPSAFAP